MSMTNSLEKTSKKKSFSLSTKLYVAFVLCLLVPCLIIGSIVYIEGTKTTSRMFAGSAQQTVEMLDVSVNDLIQSHDVAAAQFAKQYSQLAMDESGHQKILSDMNSYIATNADVASYVGLDTGTYIGENEISTNPADYDPRTRPWYKLAMEKKGKTVITEPYPNSDNPNEMDVTIARAFDNGKGVIAFDLSVTKINKIFQTAKLGRGGYAFIIDAKHNVIYYPNVKPGKPLKNVLAVDQFLNKNKGQFDYQNQNTNKEAIYKQNQVTGWRIVGTWAPSQNNSELINMLGIVGFVALLTLAVGIFVIRLLVRAIIKPVNSLLTASERITVGDLSTTITANSKDEIGLLASSFETMRQSLRNLITQIGSASTNINNASIDLADNVNELTITNQQTAVSTQAMEESVKVHSKYEDDTTGTMQEMGLGIKRIAESAMYVAESSGIVSNEANKGVDQLKQITGQMHHIANAVDQSTNVVLELEEQSKQIDQIVSLITDIATQTHLLALNAAIEAARAGEHGRGFAVVAGEVKKLAEQSADSAKQIGALIETIQSKTANAVSIASTGSKEVAKGNKIVEETAKSFSNILQMIQQVTGEMQEVSAGAEEASASSEEVIHAMENMRKATENVTTASSEIHKAVIAASSATNAVSTSVHDLQQLAVNLQRMVKQYNI